MGVQLVKNVTKVRRKLKALNPSIHSAVKAEMAKITIEMDEEVSTSISSGSRSGKTYKRRTVTHKASSANELPKSDTGELVKGFFNTVKATPNRIIGIVGNKAKHAKHLEFKPKSQGGRPFMRPLYNRWVDRANWRLKKALKSGIRKITR